MHNTKVELQGKCRRFFYAKVDGPPFVDADGNPTSDLQHVAGDILGVASGGGALGDLTGDDLVIATHNDPTAPDRIGCVEEYYEPLPAPGKTLTPVSIDLSKVEACCDAVTAHRAADQEKQDFILECGLECGSECSKEIELRYILKVAEIRTRSDSAAHDNILEKQTQLDIYCAKCESCCDTLLATRDAAVTYADVEVRA
jgi:hypothetical protein